MDGQGYVGNACQYPQDRDTQAATQRVLEYGPSTLLRVLLVKLRLRLLGPLASFIRQPNTNAAPCHSNPVDAA